MNTELIVLFDKNSQYLGLKVMPFVTAFLVLLFCVSFSWHKILNYYVLATIQCILACFIALFVITFVYALYQVKNDEPAAILNQKGMWIQNYGLIPWDNVEEISAYVLPTTPMEALGVRLKDISLVSKQAPASGRCGLFWARLFGYRYHISLAGLELEYNQIVRFSRQFIQGD